jgi:hypothetical protein
MECSNVTTPDGGKDRLAAAFPGQVPSDTDWIHRTRRNFPDQTPGEPGEDTFRLMAERMLAVIEPVEQMQSSKPNDDAGTEGRESSRPPASGTLRNAASASP